MGVLLPFRRRSKWDDLCASGRSYALLVVGSGCYELDDPYLGEKTSLWLQNAKKPLAGVMEVLSVISTDLVEYPASAFSFTERDVSNFINDGEAGYVEVGGCPQVHTHHSNGGWYGHSIGGLDCYEVGCDHEGCAWIMWWLDRRYNFKRSWHEKGEWLSAYRQTGNRGGYG